MRLLRGFAAVLIAGTLTAIAYAAPPDARLIEAVKTGDHAGAVRLLEEKADVNAPEIDGTTALHWAVRANDLEMADRLIRAGANVKAANRYSVTPLYLAAQNGSPQMIARLLKAGADANETGVEGETVLMTAARTGAVDAARVLLDAGARVDAKETWRGQTALMWAASEGHPAMVKELIARGADVNMRSNEVRWERQQTAEPRDKWLPLGNLTALFLAARDSCVDCIPILADAGGDVNATDPDGYTPLLFALINGQYDAAAALLNKGADPNLAHKSGETPLYAAVDCHTMPISNRPSPKETDNRLTSLDVIRLLLEKGADVNAQLSRQIPYRTKLDRGDDTMLAAGTTPFLRAAKAADHVVMKVLLEHGADATIASRTINPLMAAAGVGTKEEDTTGRHKSQTDIIEAIKLCLAAGIDINAADSSGRTALYGAALQGFDDVIQFLADHGADLFAKDRQERTALDAASGNVPGLGFDGSASVPHESAAALLAKLMEAKK
ncbi:MAG TPA: ankyrin repeat domain-containing protein [Terriglobia bacterium]|nr:ankyrin repeat domain-containing protein [Terriglobia bacterium]